MSNQNEKVTDQQTGQIFTLKPEEWFDIVAAWVSIGYSLAAIGYLGWVLLDTWMGKYSIWPLKDYIEMLQKQDTTVLKLVVYTAIGGGMGAAVNNIRSFVQWHAERKAFGWRFIWKYISMPPLGATLAVMVYAIIQGGIAVFSGNFSDVTTTTSFSAWATGTLAGYGSNKVFIWLDDKVNTLFKVEGAKVAVPDLSGKNKDEAEQALQEAKLTLGEVIEKQADKEKMGKVIGQTPEAKAEVAPDSKVSITIGKAGNDEAESQAAKVAVPDLSGKNKDEAEQALQEAKLALGEVSKQASEEQMIDKVIGQTPKAGTEAAPDTKVAITIGAASNDE